MKRFATIAVWLGLGALAAVTGAQMRALNPDPALRSPIIFPAPTKAIRVEHGHPAHRALRCQQCHAGTTESDHTEDLLMPTENACRPCHDAEIDRGIASPELCGTCHVLENDAPVAVARSSFPTARLRFSHQVHAQNGVRCLDCHRGINDGPTATGLHMPSMRECIACHEESENASTECDSCHLTRVDGRLAQHFPEGTMNPPAWLHGMRHDRDFLVRHRWVAADHGEECAACHVESECEDCHEGRIALPEVHPNDFLTTHPQLARRDSPECTSCHSTQTFCNECHSRLGLSQISSPASRIGERFHPPREVWNGMMHGREAQRSMTMCTSCHVERDCIACHGSSGVGAGASPHPPSFQGRCITAMRQNPRACQSCHGDLDALQARCRSP